MVGEGGEIYTRPLSFEDSLKFYKALVG